MQISTSILNSNNRLESIEKLNKTSNNYIHVDVMDGNFVPDKQFNNINELKAINILSNTPLDIHLMVENPLDYIYNYKNLNINNITFHIEVENNIKEIISKIKELGYKVGISIKPNTNIESLVPYLNDIDLILIMSVEPGKGGQKFLPNTIDRIKKIKKLIENKNIKIEVDGGINNETIKLIANIDISVVGSYIINSKNYQKQINILLNKKDT